MLHTADGLCRGDMRGAGACPLPVSGRVPLFARRTVRVRSGRTGQLPFGRADGVGRWRTFGPLSSPLVRLGRPRRGSGRWPGRFDRLGLWLLEADFAHGDLKQDNLIVMPDGSLRLIDYDGVYLPSLGG